MGLNTDLCGFPDQFYPPVEKVGLSGIRPKWMKLDRLLEFEVLSNWVKPGGKKDDLLKTQTINISPAMLRAIAEIDEFKGAWIALGCPERLDKLRRVAKRASVATGATGSFCR